MKLVGSNASPYVRRVRILLDELKADFTFVPVDIFSEQGQQEVFQYTKTRRVPVLIDGDKTVWDSHLIAKYLLEKYAAPLPRLEEEKEIILLNEANDSGIALYQVRFFDLDKEGKNIYSKIQYKRIKGILSYFDEKLANESLSWGLVANYLYCMLDWFSYRNVFPWEEYTHLKEFYDSLSSKEILQQTAP